MPAREHEVTTEAITTEDAEVDIDLAAMEVEVADTALRERLFRQADLFDDPEAYRAGVSDALEELERLHSVDAVSNPAWVAAYVLGLAWCDQDRVSHVLSVIRVVGGDVGVLRHAARRLREMEHIDDGVRARALDMLVDAIATAESPPDPGSREPADRPG